MGAILRNTVFHYNIKKKGQNIEHYNNGTTKQTTDTTTEEMPRYLDQIIFDDPLHNFPVYFIVVYIICILIYVLLSLLYYKLFHPWKIIMGKDNLLEPMQEDDSENDSQQDGRRIISR